MVVSNLKTEGYLSKEAQLFLLKDKADRVSNFILGLRRSKSRVYSQIMSEVTGVESLITLQSFLLQTSLYFRKFSDSRLNDILEVWRAHEALALYYREKDFSGVVDYLKEVKV
jgi:hypothetical protein